MQKENNSSTSFLPAWQAKQASSRQALGGVQEAHDLAFLAGMGC
jgi:hypothetical protein